MPASRNYSNVAKPISLAAAAASSGALDVAGSRVGWPAYPFAVAVERGTSNEELVLVTSAAASTAETATWNVSRGYGGTVGRAHPAGAKVEHVVHAVDFEQFRDGTHNKDTTVGTDAPSTYPTGVSRMFTATAAGWPGSYGWVETIKTATDCVQRWSGVFSTGEGQIWSRYSNGTSDSWQPWARLDDASIPRSGIFRDVTQAIAANTATFVSFPKDGYGDHVPNAWSSSWSDRATQPERLRLSSTTPAGMYVVKTELPIAVTAGSTYEVEIKAYTSSGVDRGTYAAKRWAAAASMVEVVELQSRPLNCQPGDFFNVLVRGTTAFSVEGGYIINPNLVGWRMGKA